MPEHVGLTDPDLHEPKGVRDANLGEAYVADGFGGGSWQSVKLAHPLIAYAHKERTSAAATHNVTVAEAVDTTLRHYDDYVSFTDAFTPTFSKNIDIDSDGNFVISVHGIYELNFWISEHDTFVHKEIGIATYKNQADPDSLAGPMPNHVPVLRDRVKDNLIIHALAFSGIYELEIGDTFGIALSAESDGVLSISDGNISLNLLEEL